MSGRLNDLCVVLLRVPATAVSLLNDISIVVEPPAMNEASFLKNNQKSLGEILFK